MNEFIANNGWYPTGLADFITLAEKHPEAKDAFAGELISNRDFLLKFHKYAEAGDPRIDQLMLPAKIQNAKLQELVGYAIRNNKMDLRQAFHCVLSYADAAKWRDGQKPNAALGRQITVQQISELLTAPRTFAEIQSPVDAKAFLDAYKAQLNLDF